MVIISTAYFTQYK